MRLLTWFLLTFGSACLFNLCVKADEFLLQVPGTTVVSQARLADGVLEIIDDRGERTVYLRERRFDSADRQLVGFVSDAANQVIRWPASGRGAMQIGSPAGGELHFRESRMRVRPLPGGRSTVGPPPAEVPGWEDLPARAPAAYRITTGDAEPVGGFLGLDRRGEPAMVRPGGRGQVAWWLVPASARLYRLQPLELREPLALGAASSTGPLGLHPLAGDPAQLWRVIAAPEGLYFESVAYPGRGLAGGRDRGVGLERLSGAPAQQWRLRPAGRDITPAPLYEVVSREIQPEPPLPPAKLDLANTHDRELWVLIADRLTGKASRRLRIEPGEAVRVELKRDAGATLVETYEIRGPGGVLEREQLVTRLPPAPRWDLSVYELFLQSIAIDRTGKSPERIEDVNYQPKSVGYFILPAGNALPDGRLDVYQLAREMDNRGGVRRLDLDRWSVRERRPDRLENLLEEAKRAPN